MFMIILIIFVISGVLGWLIDLKKVVIIKEDKNIIVL